VAQKVDVFIANSKETQKRIQKFYKRDAEIIFPPVSVPTKIDEKIRATALKDGYFLYVNRLAFAKHPEIAVQACTELCVPLKVVGDGKIRAELEQMAGTTVQFMGAVSDEELAELYQHAKALLYPVEDEDFGIVPVEAQGWGVPVIAHNSGGPKETILSGKTGILFDELTVDGLITAIKQFNSLTFKSATLHTHAQQFAESSFKKQILKLIKN
jgi:glycosyltransferase involved in cell wall biosynthesis